jgi:hypothetical protein
MRYRIARFLKTLAVVLSMALALGGCDSEQMPPEDDEKIATKPIMGSFMQAWGEDLENSPDQWKNELEAMQKAGMDLVIVQFTVYNGKAFFNSKRIPSVTGSDMHFLENLLSAADKMDMRVMLGLNYDMLWFNTTTSEEYIRTQLDFNLALIREIAEKYAHHPSFYGWYLTEEVNDCCLVSPAERQIQADFFSRQIRACREMTPAKPIGFSPFYTGTMNPEQYYEWWSAFLQIIDIDIVMLQDGIGVHGEERLETILPIYESLAAACKERNVALWANLELFEQVHGWPIDDGPFAAEPAQMRRVKAQIENIAPFVDALVSFSFHSYMNPAKGVLQNELYNEYFRFYEEIISEGT